MTKQAHSLVTIDYTNWRGERRERQVVVCRMIFGSNEWHPEPQWLLLAMDPEDKKEKTFAMSGIHSWNRRSPPPAVEGGWREIESAPKDGTRFLTFDDYYGVRMGRAFIRADHDDWLSYVDCNGNSSKGGIRATHWQPLPTPPHPSRRRESR